MLDIRYTGLNSRSPVVRQFHESLERGELKRFEAMRMVKGIIDSFVSERSIQFEVLHRIDVRDADAFPDDIALTEFIVDLDSAKDDLFAKYVLHALQRDLADLGRAGSIEMYGRRPMLVLSDVVIFTVGASHSIELRSTKAMQESRARASCQTPRGPADTLSAEA